MKATELRIGCSFQLENSVLGGGIATIKNKYDLDVVFDLLESNLIKPIPLTEEWLLKFGFEIGFNQKKMLDVYCKDFGLLIERSNSNNFYYKKVNIQSVHQLQNLYFALTGEELTFKSE